MPGSLLFPFPDRLIRNEESFVETFGVICNPGLLLKTPRMRTTSDGQQLVGPSSWRSRKQDRHGTNPIPGGSGWYQAHHPVGYFVTLQVARGI